MSRALDSDVRASLSQDQSAAAYEAISKALLGIEQLGEDQLLEIEFLGKSHPLPPGAFYLQDGNALAVSKQGLVQAFFAARSLFQEHNTADENKKKRLLPDALFAVTSVILLMDPEHLTAANARKRLIKSASSPWLLELVARDKRYIDSLLTSRLHRHTKSPTLWSHRRWLVDIARQHGEQPDVAEDIKTVVMVAGVRHPKNYYAWSHARWLLGKIPDHRREMVLREMMDVTGNWCVRYHSDISGWTFLCDLHMQVEDKDLVAGSFFASLGVAAGFMLANESRWFFLRTLAASGAFPPREGEDFYKSAVATHERAKKPEDKQVLARAISWYETYNRKQT